MKALQTCLFAYLTPGEDLMVNVCVVRLVGLLELIVFVMVLTTEVVIVPFRNGAWLEVSIAPTPFDAAMVTLVVCVVVRV